jgi:hypothetical protein
VRSLVAEVMVISAFMKIPAMGVRAAVGLPTFK